MDLSITSQASVGVPDSIAQFLMAADGIATLMRKQNRINVPVQGQGKMFAVCEGLAQLETAKLSADITTRALLGLYENAGSSSIKMQLCEFILDSHRKLQGRAVKDEIGLIGSSLSIIWLIRNVCYWAHVGETKIFLWRDGNLTQVNPQHTGTAFAHRDGEEISDESLAQGFMYGQLTSESKSLRLDLGVDVSSLSLQPGDVIVLCSSAVMGVYGQQALTACLRQKPLSLASLFATKIPPTQRDRMAVVAVEVE